MTIYKILTIFVTVNKKYIIMENLINVKNLEKEWSVYLLSCDNTPKTVYIGITNEQYIIARLFRHFVESVAASKTSKNEDKHKWVRENWQNIKMTILEHNIFDEEVARIEESNYVFKYIKDGYDVLNKTYTPIRVFDKYGNFYKDYSSYTAASKEFEVEPCRVISCCSTGNRLLGKYLIRKYDPEITQIEVNINNIPVDKDIPILQYDLNGNFIQEWENAFTVSKLLNIDRSQLTKCLKGKQKTAKGYIFKYKNDPVHIQYKVYMYDTNFNLVNKFKTNKECAEYLINQGLSKGNLNVVSSSISQSIKKETRYLNYVFRKTPIENKS